MLTPLRVLKLDDMVSDNSITYLFIHVLILTQEYDPSSDKELIRTSIP